MAAAAATAACVADDGLGGGSAGDIPLGEALDALFAGSQLLAAEDRVEQADRLGQRGEDDGAGLDFPVVAEDRDAQSFDDLLLGAGIDSRGRCGA